MYGTTVKIVKIHGNKFIHVTLMFRSPRYYCFCSHIHPKTLQISLKH